MLPLKFYFMVNLNRGIGLQFPCKMSQINTGRGYCLKLYNFFIPFTPSQNKLFHNGKFFPQHCLTYKSSSQSHFTPNVGSHMVKLDFPLAGHNKNIHCPQEKKKQNHKGKQSPSISASFLLHRILSFVLTFHHIAPHGVIILISYRLESCYRSLN